MASVKFLRVMSRPSRVRLDTSIILVDDKEGPIKGGYMVAEDKNLILRRASATVLSWLTTRAHFTQIVAYASLNNVCTVADRCRFSEKGA